MPTCADMCQHVKPLSAPMIPTIWNVPCMLACVSTFGHIDMCWYVPICADMCRHVPTCDINLDTSDSDHLDLIYMAACVSTCGHADMCWYVPTCANTWNHSQHLWYQPFEIYLECWHVSAHLDMPTCADMSRHVPTCADMSRHVPTCDINIDTSYSDHLHLIWMLPCVSICGHAGMCCYVPTCADMWNHSQHLWYQSFET